MVRSRKARPEWAVEFLDRLENPTGDELRRRREALDRALNVRERLDIRPLTTTELVRSIREERADYLAD